MVAQEIVPKTNSSRPKKFLREVKAELKKVSWPTKPELISNTGIVFIAVTIVCILIWALDHMLNEVLKLIIK